MPMAIPLVMAAFEAYAGATAIAAGVEGFAAIAAGLEVAGAALTVAGTVSGNQTLSRIGSIAGLVGGGINLADGLAGGGSGAMSEATMANAEGPLPADITGESAAAGTAAAVATPPPTGEPGVPGDPGTEPGGAGADQGLLKSAMTPPAQETPPQTAGADNAPSTTAPNTTAPNTTSPAQYSDYGSPTGPGAPGTSASTGAPGAAAQPVDSTTWFSQVGDVLKNGAQWMEKNPTLTKAAGGLVQGAMNYYGTQALADSNLQRAKNYQDWVRQRYSDSVRNLTVPNVGVSQAPSSGIIAGARKGP